MKKQHEKRKILRKNLAKMWKLTTTTTTFFKTISDLK